MAARTIVQVATDIDQVSARITRLEADVQAQRARLADLVREFTQCEALGQMRTRLVLEPAQDDPPVAESKPARAPRRPSNGADRDRRATIRAWAAEKGIPMPEKGRIPAPVLEQYEAEHPAETS